MSRSTVDTAGLWLDIFADQAGRRWIFVAGELDLNSAPHLDDALASAPGPVCLDLAEVSFCDAGGINVLASAHRRATAAGAELVLSRVPGPVRRLLHIVGLDTALVFVDLVDAAALAAAGLAPPRRVLLRCGG